MTAIALVNSGIDWAFGDDEDEEKPRSRTVPLPPRVRGPYDKEDDTYIQWSAPGATADLAQWLGGRETLYAIEDARTGRGSWWEVPVEVLKGPVKVFTSILNPVMKTAAELVMGKRLWPDPFNPRDLNDPVEHVTQTLALDHQYHALMGEREASDYAKDVGLAFLGATRRSGLQEHRSSDYDVIGMGHEAIGKAEKARLRRDIRNAAIKRNDKLLRKASIELFGYGVGPESISDALAYIDPAYGESKAIRLLVEADRQRRGGPNLLQRVGEYTGNYWRENPLTQAEVEGIMEKRRELAERVRKRVEAVLPDAA